MNCLECNYPLQTRLICSECGCDNTSYASAMDIETQSPGIFRRMQRGFRCVKIYAILTFALISISQLFGIISTHLMTPGSLSWAMEIWYWTLQFTGPAGTLLLFLAALWIAPRHASDGPLPPRLVKTVRVLVAYSFCWAVLPFVLKVLSMLEWPQGVRTLLENIMILCNYRWSNLLDAIVMLVAMPLFIHLCVRSAVILKSPRAQGWFRVGFFFVLASVVLQLPWLFYQFTTLIGINDYLVVDSLKPSGYLVAISWIGAVNFWVYLATIAFLLIGSICMSQHMRRLIPTTTPLHQTDGAV